LPAAIQASLPGSRTSPTRSLCCSRSIGGASTKHLYRSGVSSTDDHILWLAGGVTPNLRHDSNTGTVTMSNARGGVLMSEWPEHKLHSRIRELRGEGEADARAA
jgi:hypothetical protein